MQDFEPATLLFGTDSPLDNGACSLEPPNDPGGRACGAGQGNERAKSLQELFGRRFLLRQSNGMQERGKPALLVESSEVLGPQQKVENVEDRVGKVAVVDAELGELCNAPFMFVEQLIAEGPAAPVDG